jgi:dsDNA-specific endonuclease/ATPase MutS2
MHPEFENAGMLFDKETLEPLYKLVIGKSEDSNALFISKKMGIRDKVLNRAESYLNDKNYNLYLVKRSKIEKQDEVEEKYEVTKDYSIGDKVKLIEKDDYAIVYKGIDKFNNIEVLYKDEFI